MPNLQASTELREPTSLRHAPNRRTSQAACESLTSNKRVTANRRTRNREYPHPCQTCTKPITDAKVFSTQTASGQRKYRHLDCAVKVGLLWERLKKDETYWSFWWVALEDRSANRNALQPYSLLRRFPKTTYFHLGGCLTWGRGEGSKWNVTVAVIWSYTGKNTQASLPSSGGKTGMPSATWTQKGTYYECALWLLFSTD